MIHSNIGTQFTAANDSKNADFSIMAISITALAVNNFQAEIITYFHS